MCSIIEVVRLVIGITAGLSGTSLNVWIIGVNILDWWKVGSPSSVDLILSFIGLINCIQQIDITLDIIFAGSLSYVGFADEIHLRFLKVLICLTSLNLWSTVWLCTYYCCRIVSFTSGILFRLKMKIRILIPKLLAMSIIESVIITIPSSWNVYVSDRNLGQNATNGQKIIVTRVSYLVTLLIGTIVPLLLALIPTGLTLISLWRHTRRMKKNTPDLSTKAHIRASLTMVLLITLHITICAVSVFIVLSSFNTDHLARYISWFVIYFYSTLQAVVLISGNSKLKNGGRQLLTQIYSWREVIFRDYK
uniref:Taste receptor type 2 n=1 Tax=Pyxicephalus adspersus TaxID=30357 RepID=A0AAV3AAL3_PYXAD|nr:TPA: hypothetical protein GDO54_014773 [Pyxicephalus adspersus]